MSCAIARPHGAGEGRMQRRRPPGSSRRLAGQMTAAAANNCRCQCCQCCTLASGCHERNDEDADDDDDDGKQSGKMGTSSNRELIAGQMIRLVCSYVEREREREKYLSFSAAFDGEKWSGRCLTFRFGFRRLGDLGGALIPASIRLAGVCARFAIHSSHSVWPSWQRESSLRSFVFNRTACLPCNRPCVCTKPAQTARRSVMDYSIGSRASRVALPCVAFQCISVHFSAFQCSAGQCSAQIHHWSLG